LQVYEASVSPDGLIDTGRLYPILLQCNLSIDTLGKLWSMANQCIPGRLNQQELFTLLALIAVTQVNTLVYQSLIFMDMGYRWWFEHPTRNRVTRVPFFH